MPEVTNNPLSTESFPSGGQSLVNYIKRFETDQDKNSEKKISPLKQVAKGLSYLERKCNVLWGFQGKLGSTRDLTHCSDFPVEIFSSGLIVDLLNDTEISPVVLTTLIKFMRKTVHPENKTYNFFVDTKIIADDVDSTALSLWVFLNNPTEGLDISDEEVHQGAKAVLSNTNSEGIIESFFPPYLNKRGQLDCGTLSNVLRLMYFLGYHNSPEYSRAIEASEGFLEEKLKDDNCGFENGLFYYDCVDTFLYFLSNTLELNEKAEKRFKESIRKRLNERFGSSKFPLDISMRILTAVQLGFIDEDPMMKEKVKTEVKVLMDMQNADGSWPKDSIYRYKGWYFGCKAISTAFALKAIKMFVENCEDEL